ncbi:hypothetical protein RvY_04240-3 [Ramazzottius varieornatus]|uniref:Alcohol dehydrogenase-like N-terminal domain-containing protein n=1 Tax=Ramazzottius varieornatus TaxID=947166 RepID=A0A1D1UQZ1_RAMVA|nr:hypothetical protein RvY_04240-3 [Ramazzottius varieornatus]
MSRPNSFISPAEVLFCHIPKDRRTILMRSILRTMRAIRVSQFGGPEVLKVEQNLLIPEARDDQVVVQVKAAGVNPIETYIRSGAHGPKPTPNFALPYTPGADAAGIVTAVGSGIQSFKLRKPFSAGAMNPLTSKTRE